MMQQPVDFPNIDGSTVLEQDNNEIDVVDMIEGMTPPDVRKLGQRLGLNNTRLQAMQLADIHNEMASAWLMQFDNVPQKSGKPTWRALAKALKQMKCQGVIDKISRNHPSDQQQQQQVEFAGATPPTGKPTKPTLPLFTSFPTSRGNVNLAVEIGTKYSKFGIQLLIDDTGAQTGAIERACHHDAEDINCKIFQKWLEGNGKQPVTWNTLILVLQQIGLKELAKEI